jgi:hypothetical protein
MSNSFEKQDIELWTLNGTCMESGFEVLMKAVDVILAVNFVKSSALNSGVFITVCCAMDAASIELLLDADVRSG